VLRRIGLTKLFGAPQSKEDLRVCGVVKRQVAMLNDPGRQDSAEEAVCSQSRFMCSRAYRLVAGGDLNLLA
jgi:hypothetical protein